jgi:hypothetical protein
MIEIGRTILSLDIFEEQFICDLLKCKGACCVEGDSGAPVKPEEVERIKENYNQFINYLPKKHQEEIQNQGFSIIDSDGDEVTPLVSNKQCAYSFYNKKGILKCSIEKAWAKGNSTFRKPISCHLFPIRITEYKRFDAVNYEKLKICKPGRTCGKKNNLPLYQFLKEPLIRNFGENWFAQVEIAAKHLKEQNI